MLRKNRVITYSIIIFLLLIFIFGNSMIPGSTSSEESSFFADISIKVLYPNFYSMDIERQLSITSFSNFFVRKAAHVTEYLVLGVFVILLLKETINNAYIFLIMPIIIYVTALIDESIQMFIPGRGPSFTDTLIDLSGALTLSIVLFIITIIRKKVKHEGER